MALGVKRWQQIAGKLSRYFNSVVTHEVASDPNILPRGTSNPSVFWRKRTQALANAVCVAGSWDASRLRPKTKLSTVIVFQPSKVIWNRMAIFGEPLLCIYDCLLDGRTGHIKLQ